MGARRHTSITRRRNGLAPAGCLDILLGEHSDGGDALFSLAIFRRGMKSLGVGLQDWNCQGWNRQGQP
jgi:hypothetical protein